MSKYAVERINWIDLEHTGGWVAEDGLLLEVAVVVTDGDLNILESWDTVYGYAPEVLDAHLNDWAREHHRASGLLDDVEQVWAQERERLRDNGDEIVEILKRHDSVGAPLGGNSPHTDRLWICEHLPHLHESLHYRDIDISTIIQLLDTWQIPLPNRDDTPTVHRAMADVLRSIDTARAFRKLLTLGVD